MLLGSRGAMNSISSIPHARSRISPRQTAVRSPSKHHPAPKSRHQTPKPHHPTRKPHGPRYRPHRPLRSGRGQRSKGRFPASQGRSLSVSPNHHLEKAHRRTGVRAARCGGRAGRCQVRLRGSAAPAGRRGARAGGSAIRHWRRRSAGGVAGHGAGVAGRGGTPSQAGGNLCRSCGEAVHHGDHGVHRETQREKNEKRSVGLKQQRWNRPHPRPLSQGERGAGDLCGLRDLRVLRGECASKRHRQKGRIR